MMNREDIARMAREAHNGKVREWQECHLFYPDELERFAALVAAAEREACARLAEEQFEPQVWQRLEQAWQNGYNAGREAEREACTKVSVQYWTEDAIDSCLSVNRPRTRRARGGDA